MGAVTSCCKPSASDVLTPDAETRRRHQMEAAEKRRMQEEARGVKDPQRIKQMQQKAHEMEQKQKELDKEGGPALRWTTE